jgi:hypothetical protein
MAFIYDLTDTWNAGGTAFNAIKMNVTDTASAAASKLVTLQVGGAERFTVDKAGIGTFASVIRAAGGSTGAPAFSFGSDTNTGMWSPAADTIAFSEGGVEAMRIDSNGNVGIGTTTVNARLSLGALVSNKVFALYDDGTNQYGMGTAGSQYRMFAATGADICFGNYARSTDTFTETVRIDSSGNVGIGTSPVSQNGRTLQVDGGAGAADYRLTNNSTGAGANSGGLYSLIGLDNYLWNLESGFLSLGTNNAERMRIDASGNVGIGTSSPNGLLSFGIGSRSLAAVATYLNTDISGINVYFLSTDGTRFTDIYAGGAPNGAAGGSNLRFLTNAITAGTFPVERMRITDAGNVGIGTTSPEQTAAGRTVVGVNGSSSSLINIGSGGNFGSYWFWDGTTATLAANNSLSLLAGASPILFNNSGVERARIDSSGIVLINTTATPSSGSPKLVVDGNISGKGTVTISSSTATTIAQGAGLLLLIRDNTGGGTAVVSYENAETPVIISTSGATTFQTGAPSGSAQIQLTNRSGNLGVAALASGDRNNNVLSVTVLQAF